MDLWDENFLKKVIPKNAGAHNSIYRGKDITDLWYSGNLSQQIAEGTFDDIFIGDYIIGKTSNRRYLVADIDYYLYTGNQICKTHHIVVVPQYIVGYANMNDTDTTAGAYVNSKMRKENLTPFKTVIQDDFEESHILQHKNMLANAIIKDYESDSTWYNSDIELMNEKMVYGCDIFHNVLNTGLPKNQTIDKTQLSLFSLDKSKILAVNDGGTVEFYWLRDVASSLNFASVRSDGLANVSLASNSFGVRPYFLLY